MAGQAGYGSPVIWWNWYPIWPVATLKKPALQAPRFLVLRTFKAIGWAADDRRMAFFDWSEKYSVGVRSIDDQHKRLFELINELFDAMRAGRGDVALGKVLDGLVDYTKTHFAFEEKLLQSNGYAHLVAHRKVHEGLTAQVMDLAAKFKVGKTTLSIQTSSFLKDWLSNHILTTDKNYSAHLAGRGVH
jgi:hemerythrin